MMGIFGSLFKKKNTLKVKNITENSDSEKLMTSQFTALYSKEGNEEYKNIYLSRLIKIGFAKQNAEKLFDFECDVIRKYNKNYLLSPGFTKDWFFGLSQPFFLNYPKTKEDILKEQFFTISELCKIVDEAEWHFWNSHERCLNDEIWNEICDWRLKGNGMAFACEYLEMIEKETGISSDELSNFVGSQGEHLSKYKWE